MSAIEDVRLAFRLLRKNPGFTVAVVLLLASGIGAVTTLVSVVDTLLFRPLPYPDSDRLVRLDGPAGRFLEGGGFGLQPFLAESRTLEEAAGFVTGTLNLAGAPVPERIRAAQISSRFFQAMGVEPILGRALQDADLEPKPVPVVIMSNGLWKRRFGSDPSVLGETLSLNGRSFTVVGIMPAGFDFPGKTELWVPAAPREGLFLGAVVFKLIGRLSPDFSMEQARKEIDVLAQRERPSSGDPRIIQLRPLKTALYGEIRPALLILLGAVGLVLLIACSNAGP